MEPLLTAFIAAALAEWGAKTQLLVALLSARYRRPAPVLLAAAIAAAAGSLVAAFGGSLIHDMVPPRALSLLIALAFLFAGVEGLFPAKARKTAEGWRTGPFVTTLFCFALFEAGDRTQFVTAAIAGRFDAFALAGCGAAAGIIVSTVPAALLGARLGTDLPVRTIRIVAAILFLLTAAILAVETLRLV